MKPTGIIVLEGADCAGKTTLAQAIVEHLGGVDGCRYFHMGATENPFQLCLDTFKAAINFSNDGISILDRSWISEPAYGITYRQGSRLAVSARCFDRLLLKHAAVTVMCVPEDTKRQLELHTKMKAERVEMYDNISKVAEWYVDLMKGCIARGGHDYGSQLQQFGDFGLRHDVLRYDMFKHNPNNLKKPIYEILDRLSQLRALQFSPALKAEMTNFQGNAGMADIVFVGDNLSPRGHAFPWPWFWPEDMCGSAKFFNTILHQIGFNEVRAVYVNAHQEPNVLMGLVPFFQTLHKDKKITWVALGTKAAHALMMLGVDADPTFNVVHLRHPQYIKRFAPPQGQADYKEEIRNAVARDNKKCHRDTNQSGMVGPPLMRF